MFGTLASAGVGRNPPVSIRRDRVVAGGLHEDLIVENHGPDRRSVALELKVAADWFRRAGAQSGVGSPIVVEGRLWGLVICATGRPGQLRPEIERRIPAFTELVATAIANADAQAGTQGRLREPIEVGAYYVVAEALTNAARHAQAATVAVEVEAAEDRLRVLVRDDGVGGADLARGSGLVESPRGAGTSVEVELPLTADATVASG